MIRRAAVAVASTASGGVALFAIVLLATQRLTPTELGFFFSFLSLGALVQLADFGLSYASLQTGGSLAGSGRLHEIPSLAARIRRWNLATSSVATVAAAVIGSAIFSSRQTAAQSGGVSWKGPLAAYLLGVFLNQLTIPQMSLREGSGRVTQMWRLRLVQEWVAGIACLFALQAGWGLWSLGALVAARAAVAAVWLTTGDTLPSGKGLPPYSLKRWMVEIWPFQWRIGVSWLSGFLTYRVFAPIVLVEQGPTAAGQFGLAISMMNVLLGVSAAWPLSQAAHYAALNASGRFKDLRREFPLMLMASTAVSVAAASLLVFVLVQARMRGVIFALRFPDPAVTALVLAAAVAHHIVACFAVLLRSEGREPLLLPSIGAGLTTACVVWAAAHFGTLTTVAEATLACALLWIPVAMLLFRRWPHIPQGS
jgi:hypothetical protein